MGIVMKYLVLIFILMSSLQSAELGWSHNYKKALADAKKEHKLVYVLITSDSCRWCRKFESTTLQDKKIQKRLHREFITVYLSRDRDPIPKGFEITPIPRHYFTDADGKILYDSLGHRKVECFDAFMDNAEKKFKINK